jgi:hypothetical protein
LGDESVKQLEFFWLNIDPADDKTQSEILQRYAEAEIMVPDEIRAELDLESRPDGFGNAQLQRAEGTLFAQSDCWPEPARGAAFRA